MIKKAVVDTNILVSSFVYPDGIVREIIDLAIKKNINLVISEQIIEEYSRVLSQKFGWNSGEISENIWILRRIAAVIEPDITLKVVHADNTDNKVIECAVAAGADVIISGDRHLLNLKKYKAIPIIKPADFIRELNQL